MFIIYRYYYVKELKLANYEKSYFTSIRADIFDIQ
jgi:hypothetical protein